MASKGHRVSAAARRLNRTSQSQSSSDSFYQPTSGVDVSFDGGTGSRQSNLALGAAVSSGPPGINLSRKESYKDQRRKYRCEKRRAADELLNTLRDPSVIVRADWLKVRGTLKGWTKLWAVLKPGMLVLFKSEKTKNSHWVGTILLASCQLIERPSKKDGFCFKLFHPLEQSIWSTKGPDGESHTGVGLNPLPNAYLICRVTSQSVGKCWMDALELCMSCSSLLKRSMQQADSGSRLSCNESDAENTDPVLSSCLLSPAVAFDDVTADGDGDDSSDVSALDDDRLSSPRESPAPLETPYVANEEVFHVDVLGMGQTEELGDDNKNLLWFLLKQLRPGMDLSKVVLPTFILEPRSFLDKLADYYYHADHLSRVVHMDDPYERMKNIVAWYLSGFYKKPKGLKKPYNPILGETFRCYWQHPNGSRTYYIAEQVSHHPPVSAFYVSNRKDGFCLSSTILAKSKFYGNSTSAILEGTAQLTLLPRGEVYRVNMPYAHCKGILLGTLSVELGGKVTIACEKTGYTAEMDFKLKPLWSGQEECNRVVGRIKLGRETLATIEGKWDSLLSYTDKRSGETAVLWESTAEIRSQRLPRFTVPVDQQGEWESERLWSAVSREIAGEDQEAATHQKYLLEEAQRAGARQRKDDNSEWNTKHFDLDCGTGQYVYRYSDLRPWDPHSDLYQYESDYQVMTKTRLRAPLPRTGSVISVDLKQISKGELCSVPGIGGAIRGCRSRDSSSSPETSVIDSAVRAAGPGAAILTSSAALGRKEHITTLRLQQLLQPVEQLQQATNSELVAVRRQLQTIQQRLRADDRRTTSPWLVLLVALVVQLVITWYIAQ